MDDQQDVKDNVDPDANTSILLRFLAALKYMINLARIHYGKATIILNICILLFSTGYKIHSQDSSHKDEEVCKGCAQSECPQIVLMSLKNLAKLTEWDKEITDDLKYIRKQYVNAKMTDDVTFITGSTVEGCSIAKWFHPDQNKREIEADIQHVGAKLEKSDQIFIERIPNKPDNLKILLDKDMLQRATIPKVWSMLQESPEFFEAKYVNPHHIRKEIGEKIYRFKDTDGTTRTIAAAILGVKRDNIDINVSENSKEKGLAYTITLKVTHVKTGFITLLSLDNVAAFKCEFWPEPASEFATRSSRNNPTKFPRWPRYGVRKSIMAAGCDVVPKPSPNGDVTTEWRWSFARAETVLMNSLSDNQKRSYFVNKIIFYKHIKPMDNDAIHSYWMKTNMLWLCEEYPSDHKIWCDENLLESMVIFYQQFLTMIQTWELPHFFIPEHSLLPANTAKCLSDGSRQCVSLQDKMADKIRAIIEDIEQYTPSSDDYEDVYKMLLGSKSVVRDLAYFGQGKPDSLKENVADIKKNMDKIEQEHDSGR